LILKVLFSFKEFGQYLLMGWFFESLLTRNYMDFPIILQIKYKFTLLAICLVDISMDYRG